MSEAPTSVARLAEVVGGSVAGNGDVPVVDVVHDSREARPGVLFVAIRGFTTDGHRFVHQAVRSGASAVCVETPDPECPVPQIVVADARASLAPLAAEVHGHPSSDLRIVGITGTNGKTTVTYLLEAIAAHAGLAVSRIGTTGASVGGRTLPLSRTTPEASDLQRLLGSMRDAGVDVVAAEVSSHALSLGRVDDTAFAVVAFTNLSQDHLDFHGTMDDYFAAKASLFEAGRAARAVINTDDPHGRVLAGSVTIPMLRVGVDIRATGVEPGRSGSRFLLVTPAGSAPVSLPLAGSFNVSNALIAAGCALSLGVGVEAIAAGLDSLGPIPGRFEVVPLEGGPTVVVDYAHTPDGVSGVISSARSLGGGAVIVVLGAGGDRDRSKRPAMGRAASSADRFILTSDNPRSEPPDEIIAAVAGGVEGDVELLVEPDRREAIKRALAGANPDDTVLVLGKGHETGQEIAGVVHPFDDRRVVSEEFAALGEATS